MYAAVASMQQLDAAAADDVPVTIQMSSTL
jgi:hypothetical protein